MIQELEETIDITQTKLQAAENATNNLIGALEKRDPSTQRASVLKRIKELEAELSRCSSLHRSQSRA